MKPMNDEFPQADVAAVHILRTCNYMTLATAHENRPWSATLFYAWDERARLVFMSALDSRHVSDCLANPLVAFSIYDSSQEPGTGNGVQGAGAVHRASESELEVLLTTYYSRRFPSKSDLLPRLAGLVDRVARLSRAFGKGLFVIEPTELYCLDLRSTDVDIRLRTDIGKVSQLLPRLWPRER